MRLSAQIFERILAAHLGRDGCSAGCNKEGLHRSDFKNANGTETYEVLGRRGLKPQQDLLVCGSRAPMAKTETVPVGFGLIRRRLDCYYQHGGFCRICYGSCFAGV